MVRQSATFKKRNERLRTKLIQNIIKKNFIKIILPFRER